jgi:Holliday junction resolvasome RuvABC endonuclease subunit
MHIKLVGIDPSLSNFGFCRATYDTDIADQERRLVINGIWNVSTEIGKDRKVVRKNSDDLARAGTLQKALQIMCKDQDIAMVEVPVGSQSARAMASYGICVGVLASCPIPLVQVLPHEVKLAAVGHRQAAKEEMIAWAAAKFPLLKWNRYAKDGKVVGKGGKIVATWKMGDLKSDNEHMADACGALVAGVQTDEFLRSLALFRQRAA